MEYAGEDGSNVPVHLSPVKEEKQTLNDTSHSAYDEKLIESGFDFPCQRILSHRQLGCVAIVVTFLNETILTHSLHRKVMHFLKF